MRPDEPALAGLGALLEAAAEAGARKALEAMGRDADGAQLVALKAAGVSHRLLLDAARNGEITIHRRGHAAFVKRAELERWIVSGADMQRDPAPPADDEVGELIDLARRRRHRGGRK